MANKRKAERIGLFSLERRRVRRDTATKEEISLSFFVDLVIGLNNK